MKKTKIKDLKKGDIIIVNGNSYYEFSSWSEVFDGKVAVHRARDIPKYYLSLYSEVDVAESLYDFRKKRGV